MSDPQPTSPPLIGFDPDQSPDPRLIDACVHCGFCLTTCPSYRVIGKETDSPRGRIYQMDAIHQQQIGLSATTISHFDSCLGCLACVTACPSGVQYDQLIAATRVQIERHYPRPLPEQWLRQTLFSLFPYPERLRPLLYPIWAYQQWGLQKWFRQTGILNKLAPQLAAMESILPPLRKEQLTASVFPEVIPAQGSRRFRVGMILGCVQRLFAPEVNQATVEVLTANGCEVVIPPNQGCCAALPHHQGQEAQAQTLAKAMIDHFAPSQASEPLDAILINASGCGHTLKVYGQLLQEDAEYATKAVAFSRQVKDVQEFLAEVGLTTPLFPLKAGILKLVYQDACHMLHGQKISLQPRQLLQQIPQIELREPIDAALCCGSSGIYNLLQPEVAEELGDQKVTHLVNTGAEVIVSANIGCRLQILKHLQRKNQAAIPVLHPMELLQLSMQGKTLVT
ncbi:MAG: heterodisulfide reductase-related iron-sulfur binding cluster [Cyanobacteriota bacterium]|nr:heterodisulfide reductase-related iron-sulfur binding cluster [Cyanobacteriota bacterium]